LDRHLSVAFWNKLHNDLPNANRSDRRNDRSFFHHIHLTDEQGKRHFFRVLVDDATAENRLIIEALSHVTEDDVF
jgi:hypothetical protein